MILPLTGFRYPEDLTTDLLKDGLCMYGDVSNMTRKQLLQLYKEKTGQEIDWGHTPWFERLTEAKT